MENCVQRTGESAETMVHACFSLSSRSQTAADTHWVQHLSTVAKRQPTRLRIISTLSPDLPNRDYTCIYTDGSQSLSVAKGAAAWDHFFSVSADIVRFEYWTKDYTEMTKSRSRAQELAAALDHFFLMRAVDFCLIHRYRVCWTKGECLKVDIETENGVWKPCEELSQPRSEFLHDLRVFPHAGQLRKSSFSQFAPFPSVLSSSLQQKGLHRHIPNSNSARGITCDKGRIHIKKFAPRVSLRCEITQIVQTLLSSLSLSHSVASFTVTLAESSSGQCFLESISHLSFIDSFPPIPKYNLQRQKRSLKQLVRRRSITLYEPLTHTLPKLPYIDLHEAHERCIEVYTPQYTSKRSFSPELTVPSSPTAVSQLDTASRLLESMRESVEQAKLACAKEEKFSVFVNERKTLFRCAVKAGCEACMKDEAMRQMFKHESQLLLEEFTDRMVQTITAPRSTSMAMHMRSVHSPYRISSALSSHFLSCFCSAFSSKYPDPEIAEVLLQRMSWYQNDVVA